MNNILTSPIGIDAEIQSVQTDLYTLLIARWVNSLDAYGRVYKNKDKNDDTVYPQYINEDKSKSDVYYNDDFAGTFFFIDDDNHKSEDGFIFTSIVKCVFMVDLKKILSVSVDRADSEAQRDVVEFLRELSPGKFDIVEVQKGISNVFSGFNQEKIKDMDIQPFHCFSVNIKLSYNINDKCS